MISPVPNTKKSESCSTFSHCVLQHPAKFEAEVMRIKKVIPMIQNISDKCPKIEKKVEKKLNKAF